MELLQEKPRLKKYLLRTAVPNMAMEIYALMSALPKDCFILINRLSLSFMFSGVRSPTQENTQMNPQCCPQLDAYGCNEVENKSFPSVWQFVSSKFPLLNFIISVKWTGKFSRMRVGIAQKY